MAFGSLTVSNSLEVVRDFYRDEITDHVSYQALAEGERNPRLREVLARSAGMELKHSSFWKRYLESHGARVPAPRARWLRIALLRLLQKLFNPVLLVAALELGESRALKAYFRCLKTLDLDAHGKKALRGIIFEEIEHEVTFRRESEKLGLTNVRDFVLGMNDGLIEVLGVVVGLSAVYSSSPLTIAVSGLIVGVAGAISMGIGAFISVRSQRQVNEGTRDRMEVLFDVAPERAVEEYKDKLIGSGVPDSIAADIATQLGVKSDTLSRLLLTETPENELRSGLFTAAAYLVGAFFPLVPYFFVSQAFTALFVGFVLAALALSGVAAVISMFSAIPVKKKALEMVLSAFVAAGLSYAFGRLLQSLAGVSA
jgi:VIT1/CCC1 family predicted Fe2+/Mn2+ transporter